MTRELPGKGSFVRVDMHETMRELRVLEGVLVQEALDAVGAGPHVSLVGTVALALAYAATVDLGEADLGITRARARDAMNELIGLTRHAARERTQRTLIQLALDDPEVQGMIAAMQEDPLPLAVVCERFPESWPPMQRAVVLHMGLGVPFAIARTMAAESVAEWRVQKRTTELFGEKWYLVRVGYGIDEASLGLMVDNEARAFEARDALQREQYQGTIGRVFWLYGRNPADATAFLLGDRACRLEILGAYGQAVDEGDFLRKAGKLDPHDPARGPRWSWRSYLGQSTKEPPG